MSPRRWPWPSGPASGPRSSPGTRWPIRRCPCSGAEAGRLTHAPNNRRTITDLATVVRVPVDLLPNGEVPGFRGTDKRVLSPGELVVLLRNTDTETARVALRRAGFSPSAIDDGRVQFAVARPIDLVSPAIGTAPATTETDEQHAGRPGRVMSSALEYKPTIELDWPPRPPAVVAEQAVSSLESLRSWLGRVAVHRATWVVLIGAAALATRLTALRSAYDIFIDETSYTNIALNVAHGHGVTLYGLPFVLHPPTAFYLYGLIILVFGLHGGTESTLFGAPAGRRRPRGGHLCGHLPAGRPHGPSTGGHRGRSTARHRPAGHQLRQPGHARSTGPVGGGHHVLLHGGGRRGRSPFVQAPQPGGPGRAGRRGGDLHQGDLRPGRPVRPVPHSDWRMGRHQTGNSEGDVHRPRSSTPFPSSPTPVTSGSRSGGTAR